MEKDQEKEVIKETKGLLAKAKGVLSKGTGKGGWGSDARLNWRDDKTVIARVVPRELLPKRLVFQEKFNVHPGEAALLLSRGRNEGVIEAGQVIRSGLQDRIKSLLGAGEDLVLMMIDTGELVVRVKTGIDKRRMLLEDPDLHGKILDTLKSRPISPRRVFLEDGEKIRDHEETEERAQRDEHEKESIQRASRIKVEVEEYEALAKKLGWEDNKQMDTPLITKDRESVVLDVKLLVNLQPERVAEIYKLVGPKGVLTTQDLQFLIGQELAVRVFAPRLQHHTAEELRLNQEIMAQLHQEAEKELFQWLKNYGIQLNRLSINPATTDHERTALITKERQALEELAVTQHERDKMATFREFELLLIRDENARKFEEASKQHDHEMQKIYLGTMLEKKANELSQEEINVQIQRIKAEAEIEGRRKEKELELFGEEKKWDLEREKMLTEAKIEIDKQRAGAEIETEKMKAFYEQVRMIEAQKHQQLLQVREDQRKTQEIEQAHVQSLLELGAKVGSLSPDVLVESMRQASVRKALDQGDATGQAFAQAEGQKYMKENFKEGLTSQPPAGLVTNKQGEVLYLTGQSLPPDMARGVRPALGMRQGKPSEVKIECPECRKDIPDDSKVCPYCGKSLA